MKRMKKPSGPAVTREVEIHLVAKYFQDGVRVGDDIRLANADVVFIGPVDGDDPLGRQYILGATRPLTIDPAPLVFSDRDAAEFQHVIDLAGKQLTWGKAVKSQRKRKHAHVRHT